MRVDKVIASIFWDAEGVLLVGYLDKGHTFTDADILTQLCEKIKQIRRGKLTRGALFQYDSAPANRSTVVMAAI